MSILTLKKLKELKKLKDIRKVNKISEAAKIRSRTSTQVTNAKNAYNNIYVPVLKLIEQNKGLSLSDAVRQIKPGMAQNTISNIINRNFDRNVANLKKFLPEEEFKQYSIILDKFAGERKLFQAESSIIPSTVKGIINTSKSGPGIKQRDKYKNFFGGNLQGEHTMMIKDRYTLYNMNKMRDVKAHRAPEYAMTLERNEVIKNEIARKINRELSRKAKNVSQIREVARQPEMMAKKNMKNLNQQINDSESLIQGYSKEAEDLGLELRMVDNETGRIRHFGKRYPNIITLKKSFDDLGYSTGGLVKLLNKLKLTKKQKDLIKKAAYNPKKKPGTGPKAERERRVEQKIRDLYGKEKRWKYVKSKVPGPKSSLERKAEKEFFKHTEFWPDRKKKAAGGILSHYVR